MKSPCLRCDQRKPYCHGSCDQYKQFTESRHEILRKKSMDQDKRQLSRDHEMKYRKNLKGGWK